MALLDGQVTFHAKLIMAYDVCMHVSMHAGVCVSVSVCVCMCMCVCVCVCVCRYVSMYVRTYVCLFIKWFLLSNMINLHSYILPCHVILLNLWSLKGLLDNQICLTPTMCLLLPLKYFSTVHRPYY